MLTKIAFVHTDLRLYWGARLRTFAELLQTHSIELVVIEICGKGSPYRFAQDTKEKSLNWIQLFPDHSPEELDGKTIEPVLFKQLDAINPDVVMAGAIAFPSGALCLHWTTQRKRRIVIFDDAKREDVQRNRAIDWIKKQLFRAVDAIVLPAPEWLPTAAYWGFSEKELFYGVDVVDNAFFARKENQTPYASEGNILCIGRQIEKKNLINLLHGYRRYTEHFPNTHRGLTLIGNGPLHETIKTIKAQYNLKAVELIDFVDQTSILKHYHSAALFTLASKQDETWGLVINEAMAAGLPIAASSKVGCTNTLIKEGENGFLFDPFDIASIANCFIQFDQMNADERQTMGQNAQKSIREWGLDRFSNELLAAAKYAYNRPLKVIPIHSKVLITLWKGRYRPI